MVSTIKNVFRVQAVAESRPAREIDDVLQLTIKFILEANNRQEEIHLIYLGSALKKCSARHLKLL